MSNNGTRRRRPRSYHHRANVVTNNYEDDDYTATGLQPPPLALPDAEFTTMSLLDDAAERHDFDAIQRELRFALGLPSGGSHWMPQDDGGDDSGSVSGASGTSSAINVSHQWQGDAAPGAPLLLPRPPNSRTNSRTSLAVPPSLTINTHLAPSAAQEMEPSPRSPAGLPLTSPVDVESPAKFSNILDRVSERIVGLGAAGAAPAPVPSSSHLGADLEVTRSRDSRRFSTDALSVLSFRSHRRSGDSRGASDDSRHHDASFLQVPPQVGITVTDSRGGTTSVDSPTTKFAPSFMGSTVSSAASSVESISATASLAPLLASATTSMAPTSVPALYGKTLRRFPPTSALRQRCHRYLQHRATNVVLLAVIGLQIGLLTYRQWDPKHKGYVVAGYNWADYILVVLNCIYTVEMVARIIAYGLYDDHATFAGLGLPYPESPVAAKLWRGGPTTAWNVLVRAVDRIIPKRTTATGSTATATGAPFTATSTAAITQLDDLYPVLSASTMSSYENTTNSTAGSAAGSTTGSAAHTTTTAPPTRPIRAFLQSSWHRIDFISTVSFWISLLLSLGHYDASHNVLIFRALSCLRILRLCNLTTGTTTILTALKLAVPQLIDVSIFIGCFGLFFAIVGVQSFKSSLTRHCIWTNPDDALELWTNTDSYCGSYLDAAGHARPYFYRDGSQSSSIKGLRCPINSRCVSADNPYDGSVSFDNIFNSLEMVFVIILANTFTDIMYYTVDSDGLVASLFYVFCLFVMTVWLMNVFIAIVVASYRGVGPAVRGKRGRRWHHWFSREARQAVGPEPRLRWGELVRLPRQLWRRARGGSHGGTHGGIPGGIAGGIPGGTATASAGDTPVTPRTIYYTIEPIFPILVIADLTIQSVRRANQSRHIDHILYRLEASFTGVFACEIVVRFLVHFPRWRLFFHRRRNTVDLALAVITSIIIIQPVKAALGQAYYWLTVFQIMRFYRVILMSRFTRNLWLRILANSKEIIDLTEFLFVLTFLTSVIFARFFEGVVPRDELDPEEVPFSLQTLPNTFVGLYTITSTENWTNILYPLQGLQTNGPARVFTAVLLIGWFVVLNFVVLNIFIAVIASSLEVPEVDKRRRQLLQFIENITASIHSVENESGVMARFKNRFLRRTGTKERYQMAVVNLLLSGTGVSEFLDDGVEAGGESDGGGNKGAGGNGGSGGNGTTGGTGGTGSTGGGSRDGSRDDTVSRDDTPLHILPTNPVRRFFALNYRRIFNNPFRTPRANTATATLDQFDPTRYARSILRDRNQLIAAQNRYLQANPTYNKVFYLIGPRHPLRRMCQRIVLSSYGERIDGVEPYRRVLELFALLMFLTTLALVVEACYLTPLIRASATEQHGLYGWSFWTDVGFLQVFTVEFAVRVLADGLWFTPNAYVRLAWNNIDFVVLLSLWIELGLYLHNDGELSRFIRGFKALRALRLLTISETAKNNFHNTMLSGSGVRNIIGAGVMSLCLLLPFSLWGLNIFHGRLGYCLDGLARNDCHNEYMALVFNWDVVSPNAYVQPLLQFDNFPHAVLSLFEITSLEGWVDLLYNVMASTGRGTPPRPFASPFNGFYVLLFNFVGIVFILTVFISVIIYNYSLTTGVAYMTMPQRSWYQVRKFLVQVRPRRTPDLAAMGLVRRWCYRMAVARDPVWSAALNTVLVLHIVALMAEAFPQPTVVDRIRGTVFFASTLAFCLNAVVLVVALGPRAAIRSRWLVFYTIVLAGALITTIIGTQVSLLSAYTNFNKLFLVASLFFVIPRSDRLSQFLQVASASWPNLFSLLFTWFVLFVVFAIALNQVFGTTRIGPNGLSSLNLRTVPKALVVLFRCSFGEGWNYIMDDYKIELPLCYSENFSTDCGNKQYAYIIFISWNVISMYIFLNMFVSLILDSFSYITVSSAPVVGGGGSGAGGGGNGGAAGGANGANGGVAVDAAALMDRRAVRQFKDAWCQYDPRGTGFIRPADLPRVLARLTGPLSFHRYPRPQQQLVAHLMARWIVRKSPDPYDVSCHLDRVHHDLALPWWDSDVLRARRAAYEMFLEEAAVAMELNNEPGVLFTRVLLQLPLYAAYNTATCLNLIDFLERRLLLQRVKKRLDKKRVEAAMVAWAARWRYRTGSLANGGATGANGANGGATGANGGATGANGGATGANGGASSSASSASSGSFSRDTGGDIGGTGSGTGTGAGPFADWSDDSYDEPIQQSNATPVASPLLGGAGGGVGGVGSSPAGGTPSGVYVPRSPLFNRHATFALPSRAPTDDTAMDPQLPRRFA